MKKFKRYNTKELLQNPSIKRDMICKGTVASMSREGIDIALEEVYDMYDKFTINKIKMPDGYSFN